MTRTCAKCGAELGDMTFCPSCGTRAEAVQVPSAPAGPLPLRAAVVESLRMGGQNLLDDPRRFASYVLDLADKGLPEVRLLSQQADPQLTLPLAEAARKGDASSLRMARAKVFDYLRNERFVDEELSTKLSYELAAGVADCLGVGFDVPERKTQPAPATARQQPRPSIPSAGEKGTASATGAIRTSQPSARPASSTAATATARSQYRAKYRAQAQPKPQTKPQTQTKTQPQPQTKPQTQTKTQPQTQAQPQSANNLTWAIIMLFLVIGLLIIVGNSGMRRAESIDESVTVYKGNYESEMTVVSAKASHSDDATTVKLTIKNERNLDYRTLACCFVFLDSDGNVVFRTTKAAAILSFSEASCTAEGPPEAETVEVYLE